MDESNEDGAFQEDDHRAAFIFIPPVADENVVTSAAATTRPVKRRRVVGGGTAATAIANTTKRGQGRKSLANGNTSSGSGSSMIAFPPLLSGLESPACAALRESLFHAAWPALETRVQDVLRGANGKTLEEVREFLLRSSPSAAGAAATEGRIPAGFIITGPNIASQDLLFEQLGEVLCGDGEGGGEVDEAEAGEDKRWAGFVRLRAGEAGNLKAALKKIVKGGSGGRDGNEDDEREEAGRRFLDYDLEALHVALKAKGKSTRVVVVFQDSEAFDNGLIMDLVQLFHSWLDRIQFSVLFGIATSVELFQARLLKSTARQLYGAQFDVVQADSVLESVFKTAVAGSQAVVRLGPGLLRSLVERQQHQVAGIQVFISSLKYAYMCHFYANSLSLLLADDSGLQRKLLQTEHLEAVRTLESFKFHVEASVEAGQLIHAESLLEDDVYLTKRILEEGSSRKEYLLQLLQSLHLIGATQLHPSSFTDLYILALSDGIDLSSEDSPLLDNVKRLGPTDLTALVSRLLDAIQLGSPDLGLDGWEADARTFVNTLSEIRGEIEGLVQLAKENGNSLKSKYGAQSKIVRTTVVAQKVQLSHDSATLTGEDKYFTNAIDRLAELLSRHVYCEPATSCLLHEAWLYDSKSPYRDVFIPRPGMMFARALFRPHDYLSCTCCRKANGTVAATLPTTAILYHLYTEAGALVNVADLWSAYYVLVGEESEVGLDERTALVHFYRGLSELKTMGFVKQSKKKADHIAKLKWL